jgi:hypothetical protein
MLRVHALSFLGRDIEEWRVKSVDVFREEMTALRRQTSGFLGIGMIEGIMLEAVRWYRREGGLGLGEEFPQLLTPDAGSSVSIANDCNRLVVLLVAVRGCHLGQ